MLASLALLLALCPSTTAFTAGAASLQQCRTSGSRVSSSSIQMINLFGRDSDSKKQREMLSYRDARPGDRKVTFRKPNQATEGLSLGLKFRESFGKAVYIDKIIPNSEADRLKKAGQISEGDEITMVSATFGDEMWSAKNVGKYRLEKSIAVRQGMTISFVFEGSDADSKRRAKLREEAAKKEAAKMSRLQAQLADEVKATKKKNFFGF